MIKPVRIFEAFSGYGSQSLALERLNIPYKIVNISEIDKYAIKSYTALHGNVLNLGDISKIKSDEVSVHDLMTYSFPCQDISLAGKQKGLIVGETRSGLLWECERIIKDKKPKYLLMENVKNLVSKKFISDFEKWKHKLETLGYTNYTKVINACDYGIPQNRERVFMISILGEHKPYKFPKPFNVKTKLIDFLEDEVDEKYYISQDKINKLLTNLKDERLRSKLSCTDKIEILGTTQNADAKGTNSRSWVYNSNKYIGCLDSTMYKEPKKVAILCDKDCKNAVKINNKFYKIRCLTPRECFRLMGLTDEEIDKIQATGISDTQQYRLAGNSIVINVLVEIFKNLFIEN